jgi:uncharacterized membrane protein YccF (DUF307 family)
MLCPRCDTPQAENARFCDHCGAALTGSGSTPPSPVYTLSSAPMRGASCSRCAQTNPLGAHFCVYCASPLAGSAPVYQSPAYAGGAPVATVTYAPTVNLALPINANLVLRAIWFFFVGWWLGLIWTLVAWLFNLTLIGLPVGAMMLNAIPQIMTLQPRRTMRAQMMPNGNLVLHQPVQNPLPLRAIWFVLIGSWASLIWMLIAWAFSASLILTPIAFWMFNRVPTITTLAAE